MFTIPWIVKLHICNLIAVKMEIFFIHYYRAFVSNKHTFTLRSVCLVEQPFVKIVFHIFQCLVAQKKKNGQRKTIFSQRKILIKIRLIFYRLFFNFFFENQSLFHGKLSHFFSPHTFTVINFGLSSSIDLSLSLSLSLSLLYNTVLWLYFFRLIDLSIAPTCKWEHICSGNYFIPLFQNPNSLLWISSLIFFFL